MNTFCRSPVWYSNLGTFDSCWYFLDSLSQEAPNQSRICVSALFTFHCSFSFFSYPFTYPFIWIISALSVSTFNRKAYENTLFQNNNYKKRNCFFLINRKFILIFLIEVVSRIKAELEWGKVAYMSLCGRTNDMLPRYHNLLHTSLEEILIFLYNYSPNFVLPKNIKNA